MSNDLATQGLKFALYANELNRAVKRELEQIDQIGKVFERVGRHNDDQGQELAELALMLQNASASVQALMDQFLADIGGV